MNALHAILSLSTVRGFLIISHTGDESDTETVPIFVAEATGQIEPSDGLHICHERSPGSDESILRRLNAGELSGTHVYHAGCGNDVSCGFAHWRIELTGDLPAAA